MKIKLATEADFIRIKKHYWNIIEQMQDVEYPTKWQKGVYPDDESLEGFINRGEMYILEDSTGIVGSMAINYAKSDGYDQVKWGVDATEDEVSVIHILGVNPEWQGKGIAKRLIDEAIQISKLSNLKAIRLDALCDNIPAQHLYVNKGFIYRGTVELYYENTGRTNFLLYEYIL